MEVQRKAQYPVLGQFGKSLENFCLLMHLKYFCTRRKERCIQLVPGVLCCMAAKPGHKKKVTSAELIEQTRNWYDGWAMSVWVIENHQKSYDFGWVLLILRMFCVKQDLNVWASWKNRQKNPVNKYSFIVVGNQRGKRNPFKIWIELINNDLRKLRLQQGLTDIISAGLGGNPSEKRNLIQAMLAWKRM